MNLDAITKTARQNLDAIVKTAEESTISAKKSIKITIYGIWISLILGIASIAYSVYLSKESSDNLKKAGDELRLSTKDMQVYKDSILLPKDTL